MSEVKTRFAPSPTGDLHLGHAYSALFAHDAAQAAAGTFLLRFEDIDSTRCRPEYEAGIRADLAWLGFEWPEPCRRQSEHFTDYQAALEQLRDMGLIYPCFCTRKDIEREIAESGQAPHGPAGVLYPGTCRRLEASKRAEKIASGLPYAWRLDVAKACRVAGGPLHWQDRSAGIITARPELLGDVVLARKEIPASYHLAVTVDDHLQGVTLVTRGDDLFHATHLHRLLQALLGFDVPDYHHHRLLQGPDGKRFAKRDRSVTLRELRQRELSPADIRRMIDDLSSRRT